MIGGTAIKFFIIGLLIGLILMAMFAGAARADDAEDPALFACKRVIFAGLRDPDSAKALYGERVVQQTPKGWLVILPVRATNGFGATIKQTFVCAYRDGKVVAVK